MRGSAACGRSRWWRSSCPGAWRWPRRWRRSPGTARRSARPDSGPHRSQAERCSESGGTRDIHAQLGFDSRRGSASSSRQAADQHEPQPRYSPDARRIPHVRTRIHRLSHYINGGTRVPAQPRDNTFHYRPLRRLAAAYLRSYGWRPVCPFPARPDRLGPWPPPRTSERTSHDRAQCAAAAAPLERFVDAYIATTTAVAAVTAAPCSARRALPAAVLASWRKVLPPGRH